MASQLLLAALLRLAIGVQQVQFDDPRRRRAEARDGRLDGERAAARQDLAREPHVAQAVVGRVGDAHVDHVDAQAAKLAKLLPQRGRCSSGQAPRERSVKMYSSFRSSSLWRRSFTARSIAIGSGCELATVSSCAIRSLAAPRSAGNAAAEPSRVSSTAISLSLGQLRQQPAAEFAGGLQPGLVLVAIFHARGGVEHQRRRHRRLLAADAGRLHARPGQGERQQRNRPRPQQQEQQMPQPQPPPVHVVPLLDEPQRRKLQQRRPPPHDQMQHDRQSRPTRLMEAHSRSELERARNLLKSGGITDKDLKAAELAEQDARAQAGVASAQCEEARAAIQVAEKRVNDTIIRSPVAGVIQTKFINVGSYVEAPTMLFAVVNNDRLELESPVATADLAPIRSGQRVTFSVNSYPGVTFEGRVVEIAPAVDAATRSAKVRIRLADSRGRLKAGMFAEGDILTGTTSQAIIIPGSAVYRDDRSSKSSFVFVLVNGKAERRPVQIGRERDGKLEIVEGLKPGDALISEQSIEIAEGVAVKARS